MQKPSLLWPRAFAARLDVWRRDARTIVRDLTGPRPVPFDRREPLARHQRQLPSSLQSVPAPVGLAARAVLIHQIQRETADAVTLILEDPSGRPFIFTPGQFLTLLLTLPDGQALRRAYSLCTAPGELPTHRVAITVKRVAGGAVSQQLNDQARAGDSLAVLGPSGQFGVRPDAALRRDLVLIGGGSGITPLLSITRAVLAEEPGSRVTLLYGNRGQRDILFHDALVALAAQHPRRFTLRLVLEDPAADWPHGRGRLDAQVCAAELARLRGEDGSDGEPPADRRYLLCGPSPMMAAARAALLARGVAPAAISEERFQSPGWLRPAPASTPQPLHIHAGARRFAATAAPGQTLLEAGLAAGAPMPYSCALGGCGACKVRLRGGAVVSDEPNCLTREERDAGCVLACVSRLAQPPAGAASDAAVVELL